MAHTEESERTGDAVLITGEWSRKRDVSLQAAIATLLRVVALLAVYTSLIQFGINGAVRATLVAAQAADAV